ncbi:unnamed protein product [Parnassius mnemosyne]|uniref:Peptidase M14 domain-containing protein n=1 Tax=Parnassius mnemosyne TaxID=213953 RepID=A0AAV1KLG2_9NEOP
MASLIVILYLLLMPYVKCVPRKYYNYTLLSATPINDKQLNFFKNLTLSYDVNFWRPPGQVNKTIELVVSPEHKKAFMNDAKQSGVYLITVMKDVQSVFDMQTVKTYIRRKMGLFDWRSYFKTNDIYKWLQDLSNNHPQEVHLESIGKTHENRDIMAVRIVLGQDKYFYRSRVIIEGGIHAREWISPAFVTYMMQQIVQSPTSNNSILKEIAQAYEWYFVPLLNPDGYEITHTSDRLWRKNSRGVDLNRNFEIAFGSVDVSSNPLADTYSGKNAFSERESAAMATYVRSKSDRLDFYLAFHSYGQHMIIPYAYSRQHRENFDEVYQMGKKAAIRIADKYGTEYTVGTAYETVGYLTSGVSGCWVKRTFKVPYVITFELRDQGYYGFALPAKEILPTCEETMEGVLSLLSTKYKREGNPLPKSGQGYNLLNTLVTIWNIILFILTRED